LAIYDEIGCGLKANTVKEGDEAVSK